MNKITLCLLMVIIISSSCGEAKSIKTNPQPLPSASDKWNVKLTQTGGIAGVFLTVKVSSDGQLIAENQRSQQNVTKTLSSQTIAELRGLIFNSVLSTSHVQQTGCADCFIYDLEIQSEGNNVKIQVDDVSINNSGAQELITTLLRIRDDALRPNP
jgi:hypothetical protein